VKTTVLLSAALALVLGAATPGPMVAQDTSSEDLKTVLTVSVAGFDAVMKSVDALATAAGVPEMTMLPKLMLGGPAGPGGLDGSKPLGLVVQTDGEKFPAMVFAPITDAEEFLQFLKGFVQDIPEPDADGVYEVEAGGQSTFIQQKDGWAFAVREREALADTPADPAALLNGMEKEYAVAIQAQVGNVPQQLRESAMMIMQMAAMAGSQRKEGESDDQYALRQKMTQQSLDGIQKLVKEMDSLTIGLGVDATNGAINLDIAITAVKGTSLAEDMAETAGLKSAFTGFFSPDAALTFRATGKLSESDVTQALQILEVVKSQGKEAIEAEDLGEAQTKQALEIGAELLAVVEETINGRTIDGGLSLVAGDDGIALVFGGHVADGAKLNEIFKKVVEQAREEEPDIDQFLKMNAAEHEGVRFHTLSIPAALVFEDGVPPAYADSDIKITIGFGDSAIYLAHGPDPVKLLKAAIDQSAAAPDAAVVPMQFSLSARSIGSLLEIIGESEDADIPAELIAALKQAGEQDHVLISAEAIPNGMKTRLMIEGGVLKVIGAAAKAAGAAGQGGF
jgi:hypothetical protein